MEPKDIALLAALPLMVVALVWDLRTRRIPNWLTVSAFAAGLVFHTVMSGWAGLGFALGGFAAGFGLLLVLWLIGGGGGGDVKLMGALGAWLGATRILMVFFGSAIVALLLVLGLFVYQLLSRAGQPAYATAGGRSGGHDSKTQMNRARRMIPYAVPAAIAMMALVGIRMLVVWTG